MKSIQSPTATAYKDQSKRPFDGDRIAAEVKITRPTARARIKNALFRDARRRVSEAIRAK